MREAPPQVSDWTPSYLAPPIPVCKVGRNKNCQQAIQPRGQDRALKLSWESMSRLLL